MLKALMDFLAAWFARSVDLWFKFMGSLARVGMLKLGLIVGAIVGVVEANLHILEFEGRVLVGIMSGVSMVNGAQLQASMVGQLFALVNTFIPLSECIGLIMLLFDFYVMIALVLALRKMIKVLEAGWKMALALITSI